MSGAAVRTWALMALPAACLVCALSARPGGPDPTVARGGGRPRGGVPAGGGAPMLVCAGGGATGALQARGHDPVPIPAGGCEEGDLRGGGSHRAPGANPEELWRRSAGGNYRVPAASELARVRRLFVRLFAGDWDSPETRDLSLSLALELVPCRDPSGLRILAVRETAERKSGRGFYLFRAGAVSELALQAPHRFRDLHTGALVFHLFLEGRAAAAAWNTVPRDAAAARGGPPPDVAHLEESYFQAFTSAFAAVHPRGRLVQVHGFSRTKRRTRAAREAAAIVSRGESEGAGRLAELALCLGTALERRIAVYPLDTKELGGTRNRQGALLRALGRTAFLHLELDRDARERLRTSRSLRLRFLRCIEEYRW